MPITPDPKKFQAAKKRLRKSLQKIIRIHQELVADISEWNETRTEHAPFDAGGDRVIVKMAKEILALVEAEKLVPDGLMSRLTHQILANAAR